MMGGGLVKAARSAGCFVIVCVMMGSCPLVLYGGPINTDVAFTPRKGGTILRLLYSYSEADGSGSGNMLHGNTSGLRTTYIHGATENTALFVNASYINRQVDRFDRRLGRIEDERSGVSDVTVMAKYRFWQQDVRAQETLRWAGLLGLNVRSGDSDFSSDSYDPILGSVFTWRRDRHLFSADLIHQFNTGSGAQRHDTLRYDLGYSYRIYPAVFTPGITHEWDAVAELNGRYTTNGEHEFFLAPGVQFVTPQWALEASLQLPAVQELKNAALETDFRLVFGVRFRW